MRTILKFALVLCLSIFSLNAFAQGCTKPPGGHCVDISWIASTTTGVTYNVYKAATPVTTTVCTGVKIQSGITGLTASDNNVVNGTTVYYQVSAVKGDESACTLQVQVQIPIPPGPPSNPSATVL